MPLPGSGKSLRIPLGVIWHSVQMLADAELLAKAHQRCSLAKWFADTRQLHVSSAPPFGPLIAEQTPSLRASRRLVQSPLQPSPQASRHRASFQESVGLQALAKERVRLVEDQGNQAQPEAPLLTRHRRTCLEAQGSWPRLIAQGDIPVGYQRKEEQA